MNKRISFTAGLTGLAGIAAIGAMLLVPAPAKAWGVIVGLPPVAVGVPLYPPPPAYYYPPGYYYPPYAYAPPPPAQTPAPAQPAPQSQAQAQDTRPYGSMCHAGVYSCSAFYGAHVGDVCSCAGIGAPSYGRVN